MNAAVRRQASEIEPLRLPVLDAALARLRRRLGQAAENGELVAASIDYAVSPWALRELLRELEAGLDLERQALFALPWFELRDDVERTCFVHARSNARSALPLLLLHGYSCGVAEFQHQVPALTAGAGGQAFHVVCPSLPGFGLTSSEAHPRAVAERCAALMQRLGYSRYVVHGSDLGARLALELGALDSEHVAALNVTALPAYPAWVGDAPCALSAPEKSRLLRLSELARELAELPSSPLEELAYALSHIDDELGAPSRAFVHSLLMGLLISSASGDPHGRSALQQRRLEPAAPSTVPTALNAFPLDTPSLRRFAEARYRVAEWHEHERGGSMPALEQPALWLASLNDWGKQLH